MWWQCSGISDITQYLANRAWPFFTVLHLRYSRSHQNAMYRLAVRKLLCNILPWVFYKQFFWHILWQREIYKYQRQPRIILYTVYISTHRTRGNMTNNFVPACLFLCFPNTIMKQSIGNKANINGNRRNVRKTDDQGNIATTLHA